jgi:aminobenzoyl-glutamate utilization protein B
MKLTRMFLVALAAVMFPAAAHSDKTDDVKKEAISWITAHRGEIEDAAKAVHGFAETSLSENRSSKLLSGMLERGGFTVERGVADMPTAFVASYGSGAPVIGIIAEFDALPGLSQKGASTVKEPVAEGAPGHGCGHNLFGAGSVGAALALKTVMEKNRIPGTIKLFGCPAEETAIGKVYMVKAGVFKGLDACLNWHPSDINEVDIGSNRALNSFTVAFHGKSAHAATDPWNGRSALDAVELMDAGVNALREHMREPVRIHNVITDGGKAPNIVPDYARSWYFVRDATRGGVEDVYARVLKCAEGAALMTGTTYEVNLITGVYNYLPNKTLSAVLDRNFRAVGAPAFTPEEQAFARAMQKTLGMKEDGLSTKIEPFEEPKTVSGGSTDVSDVSWNVPTNGEVSVAARPLGSPSHSWTVASSSCSSAGFRGMITAAEVVAASGIDLLLDPSIIEKAKTEFAEETKGFTYRSPIPDGQKPPVPGK